MKLQVPFIQLPIRFDAAALAAEIDALEDGVWLPHPAGYEGNDFLPLISAHGDPYSEAFEGPMRPTPLLERCPYLMQVLASLGVTLGRTRLMRLSGQAEVSPHVDVNYYWRERMRVHVPVVTQPTVRFDCGPQHVNMKAGECWIFDTWSTHRVLNDAEQSRIHLVVDTVGGTGFWELVSAARTPSHPTPTGWTARLVAPEPGAPPPVLDFESVNVPTVMSPWEAREHINFLLGEAVQASPALPAVYQATSRFLHVWFGLWSAHGDDRAGWPRYREALDRLISDLKAARAETVALRNGAHFINALFNMVIDTALSDRERDHLIGERRDGPGGVAKPAVLKGLPGEPDPQFDRPVFIVNPPRSGSSLLFETLAQAPGLHTVGGESHAVIEGVEALGMPARGWESNRLTAGDVTPEIAGELRAAFAGMLRDRDGRPAQGRRVRMLEKTPKNALRVPFLARVFPEARWVWLHRDPRQVLASMMEAWESGRFRTYPTLPGWKDERPWSMLLVPGWRDLAGQPLNQIVAAQWAATVRTVLDDLDAIPADRRTSVRYDAFVGDPDGEIRRLCDALDLEWDRPLGESLPLSSHTVSKPAADKWRARQAEIEAVLPGLADLIARAESAAAR